MHAIPEVKLSLEWIGVKLKPTVKLSRSEESKIGGGNVMIHAHADGQVVT